MISALYLLFLMVNTFMKFRIQFILLLFIIPFGLQKSSAQSEDKIGKKKGIVIPITKKSEIKKPPNLHFNTKNGFKKAYSTTTKKKIANEKAKELNNKGIISNEKVLEERFKENFKAINRQYKRVDQDMGNFRSNSKYVRIICRDYQHPDGDRVTIYINDIPAVYNIVLTQAYQEFKIPLRKGINKIAFKALNQGTSGPNTAGFKIYDDAKSLISSNEWNLATGAVATLLIVKDK